ncbi:cysteine protease ATG4D [Clupea harengus]|uniref:Cysteine protease n=1 Tax=Clupea harengus TaxID=7950 RepID=A0A6P8FQN3_CLUHA|nr:cysteine protease ATG4D [Clupea harengus]XP_031428684.1 cysteine protease ATG4D [Clupea harengus]
MAMNPVTPGDSPAQSDVSLLSSPGSMGSAGASEDAEKPEDRVRIKSKLVSAWNSVKYGWSFKSKSHFNKRSPLVLLGHYYLLSYSGEREAFRRAFSSLLWLTYRKGFPQLADSTLTSDCGWGCMLRSGQMLLAQGLLLHLLPPGWTWAASHHVTKDDLEVLSPRPSSSTSVASAECPRARTKSMGCSLLERGGSGSEATHRMVVSWFVDQPGCPFGLHQLVEMGKSHGKKAGDWYGPATAAHIIRNAVAASELSDLVVYVAQDCTVYKGDIVRQCERPQHEGPRGRGAAWRSLILLVPVRLGGDVLNPAYTECVKRLLGLECCIGIIGGKPKHSLYFVGFQDQQLVYLDPHYSQSAVDITQEDFPIESFHCKSARKMAFSRMDPSCTVGFYARGQHEFETLCALVSAVLNYDTNKYPMFTFAEGQRAAEEDDARSEMSLFSEVCILSSKASHASLSSGTDDFVLL